MEDTVYVLGFDYDSTITEEDTVERIVRAALRDNREKAKGTAGGGGSAYTPEEGEAKLGGIVEKYFAEQREFMSSAPMTSVQDFCEAQRVFDRRMNHDFVATGLLKGLEERTLRSHGRHVPLRVGARSLLSDLLARSAGPKPGAAAVEAHVVSLCWSRAFLTESLHLPPHLLEALPVHCNELEWRDGVCEGGEIVRSVQDPVDKAELMASLVRRAKERDPGRLCKTVFVGDSVGDLLAMVRSDVGILMGSSPGKVIGAVCRGCGVKVVDVEPGQSLSCLSGLREAEPGGLVFRVGSWAELRAIFEEEGLVERHPRNPATVLCISGSDSGGGAGNQADLKTCSSYGVFGMSAITALTAQNTRGVSSISGVDAGFVGEQIDAVVGDIGADAVKTGMLATEEIVEVVASKVRAHALRNVVVDPVLVATSGDALARGGVVSAYLRELFPLATVVTPNIPEAEALLGLKAGSIQTTEDAARAARELHKFGPRWVLVKGGHLTSTSVCADVLFDGDDIHVLETDLVETSSTHGTGCTLGSAIACGLAGGMGVLESVRAAKGYVTGVITSSRDMGLGRGGAQGPMHHQPLLRTAAGPHLLSPSALRFYAVTDSGMNERNGRGLAEAVLAAVRGGATIVQLREKRASTADLIEQARVVVRVCRPLGIPVIVNDRVDVAIAADADGVHVGDDDMPLEDARRIIGPLKILGASVKNRDQALQAQREGADYVGAGACYTTSTKSDSVLVGLEAVREIKEAVSIPVVAIGGINEKNAAEVLALTGADGVAVVSAVFGGPDVEESSRRMREVLSKVY